MKHFFILSILILISFQVFPQEFVPRAGNIFNKDTETNLLRHSFPSANGIKTVINFDSSNVSFRGNYPFAESYALSMSDSGDLAFIGSGGGIFVTDITDPANPEILSEIRTRSLVDNCTYDPVRKRLYVCAYFSGIEIWDLSNLSDPERMSRVPTEPYPRSGVAFLEDYLLVTTNNSLWTIDMADPYNPIIVEELFITSNLIVQMYLKDTVVYIVSDLQGLKTVDASDPLDLQLIVSTAYGSGSRFDISGNYLYAAKDGGLTVLDISNPASITFMGSLSLTGYIDDITVFNDKAYISKFGTGGGLEIINVANPSSPVSLSVFSGDFRLIEGAGNYVYLTRNSRFTVLDVTDPQSVQEVSGLDLPAFVQDVSVSGRYAYTGSNGFRVIDISDSTHPSLAGYSEINGSLVEASGDSLVIYCPYSMSNGNKVYVMDVTDPAAPVSLDYVTPPAMTWDLVLKDNLAVVACWWDGVRIFSFEDPADFRQVSHAMGWVQGGIPGTEWCYAQAADIEGNYLYIVDYEPFTNEDTYGLYIIDVSNLSAPVLVKRFEGISSHAQDVRVKNGIAYIADGNGGVEIVNVSDPLNPSVIAYVTLPDGATGLTVEGDYVYASNYILGGVQVIDITDPANPDIAGYYKPSGCFALSVEADNGFIYLSDGLAGIQVYRNLLEPVTSVEPDEMIADNFNLFNYPNPFNPSTSIEFTLPESGNTILRVFNTLGEEVAVLLNDFIKSGTHKFTFNASGLSSGIYYYTLESGNKFLAGKMVLMK